MLSRKLPTLLMKKEGVKLIAIGQQHSMVYKKNGQLVVFGCGAHGKLGLGDQKPRKVPTELMVDKTIKGSFSLKQF